MINWAWRRIAQALCVDQAAAYMAHQAATFPLYVNQKGTTS